MPKVSPWKLVGARAGDGGDDRGAGILIFGLEVGGEDTELRHRQLGEGIAAADVLADDAALVDVAPEADAVDEDVDLRPAEAVAVAIHADAAAAEGLAELGLQHPDARRERGEIEEVAVVLRQVLDLVVGDVGADLRRARLAEPGADDDDVGVVARRRRRPARRAVSTIERRIWPTETITRWAGPAAPSRAGDS